MTTQQTPFEWRFIYHPRFWPTWLGLGLLWLLAQLPYRVLLIIGQLLGVLIWAFDAERRRITRTNLRLCFPQMDPHSLRRLALESFYSTGMAIVESALTWWGSDRKVNPLLHVQGIEHYHAAMQQGKGALLLGGHYATLEMGGRIMLRHAQNFYPTFKQARDPLFNWMMQSQRIKRHGGLVNSSNIREVLKILRKNIALWYAPDQDFGMTSSVFAPFMGVPAATLTMTSRLAKASGAPVLPWYCERLSNGQGYLVRIEPPLQNFPTGDDVRDATTVNAVIEAQVRRTPEQYLWGHRRFKTRPLGQPMVYAPRRDRPLRRYDFFNALLALPYLLYTFWLANRHRDWSYWDQRLSLYPESLEGPVDLWFHAASVGEVVALLPLIEAMQKVYPYKKIILTTFTPTGGAMARQRLPTTVAQYYLPIDWVWCVKRFLDEARPRCAIFMETELWPNLHEYCYNRAVPVILINGRLSERSLKAPHWMRWLTARSSQYLRHILARTELDAQRFKSIGVQDDHIEVAGNIKFAIVNKPPAPPIDLGRPYILAASTHEDEELQLARLWRELAIHSHILVIAPRHPHRAKQIRRDFEEQQIRYAQRSRQDPLTENIDVYLADTFGELDKFIAGSAFVFMGGSLVKRGGHNILEVGAQGKAVIFGPHMDNFLAERELFLSHAAAVEVADVAALANVIRDLLSHPEKAAELGQHALAAMQSQAHVLTHYVTRLQALIDQHTQA